MLKSKLLSYTCTCVRTSSNVVNIAQLPWLSTLYSGTQITRIFLWILISIIALAPPISTTFQGHWCEWDWILFVIIPTQVLNWNWMVSSMCQQLGHWMTLWVTIAMHFQLGHFESEILMKIRVQYIAYCPEFAYLTEWIKLFLACNRWKMSATCFSLCVYLRSTARQIDIGG